MAVEFEALVARMLGAVPGLTVAVESVRDDGGVDAVLEFAGSAARVAQEMTTSSFPRLAASWLPADTRGASLLTHNLRWLP